MAVEPPVFRGDERDQQRRVHLRQGDPLLQRAIAGAGGAERGAAPIQEPERGRDRLIEERPRQRQRQPPGDRRGQRQRRTGTAQHHASASHGDLAFTVNTPPSVRPYTAGLYISSAKAGGRTKTPGVVARAT